MDKDAWKHTWSTLTSSSARLHAELDKLQGTPLLKGLLLTDSPAEQGHAHIFKRVTDARQQLVDLQQLVSAGEGQANAAFIAALSERITSFAKQLNGIKQQQRSDYAALLQEEQQLQEELAVLDLTLADWGQQQQGYDAQEQEAAAAGQPRHSADTHPSCSLRGSDSASAADCVCRSPDRPGRQAGGSSSQNGSPVKGVAPCGAAAAAAAGSGGGGGGLPPEVQAYDAFLARHGDTGGWHADDHKTFMALLKTHRGDYNAALAAIVDALPLQTRKSVIAHCRWHADLCELDMRKRIALVNWRTAKEAAKAALRAQAVALGDTSCSDMAAGSNLAGPFSLPADQQQRVSRQLKQQLVQQWRHEQAAAREEAARAAQEQQRLQQQQERQLRQQRQEELRRQLQEAKAARQRQEQEVEAAARQAHQAKSGLDPEQRQRLQQRNSAALERQQQLKAAKQAKQEAKERAQQQLLEAAQGMRPKVERDPSRLLSATTAAAARAAAAAAGAKEAAAAQGSRGRTGSGFVLHVTHKATPNWAAGVPGL